jgi:hypothetical protein
MEAWSASETVAFSTLDAYARGVDNVLHVLYPRHEAVGRWAVTPDLEDMVPLVLAQRAARDLRSDAEGEWGKSIALAEVLGPLYNRGGTLGSEVKFPRDDIREVVEAELRTVQDALWKHKDLFDSSLELTGSVSRGTDLDHDVDVVVAVVAKELEVGPGKLGEERSSFRRRFEDAVRGALSRFIVPDTVRQQSHSISFTMELARKQTPVDVVPMVRAEFGGAHVYLVPDFNEGKWELTCARLIADVPEGLHDAEQKLLRWLVRAVKAWKAKVVEAVRKLDSPEGIRENDLSLMPSTFWELAVRTYFGKRIDVDRGVAQEKPGVLLNKALLWLADMVRNGGTKVEYPGLPEMKAWWDTKGKRLGTVRNVEGLGVPGMMGMGEDARRCVTMILEDSAEHLKGVEQDPDLTSVVLLPPNKIIVKELQKALVEEKLQKALVEDEAAQNTTE